jgi:ribosomal protein L37AE/L43A
VSDAITDWNRDSDKHICYECSRLRHEHRDDGKYFCTSCDTKFELKPPGSGFYQFSIWKAIK